MKNCLFCKHFFYRTGYHDYSDITPGESVEIRCGKRIWELYQFMDSEDDFRAKMVTAETCASYEIREESDD